MEFFNRATGPSISPFGAFTNINSFNVDAREYVNAFLDALVSSIVYNSAWSNYGASLKTNNLLHEYEQKYNKTLSDTNFGTNFAQLGDIAIEALNAYASGGNGMEVILSSIFAALPSPESGQISFIYEQLGFKEKNAKKVAIAGELVEVIKNSDLRFVATESNVEKLLIEYIEDEQNRIIEVGYDSLSNQKYDAYRLFYLEEIKLLNINNVNDRVKDIENYINDKWDKITIK